VADSEKSFLGTGWGFPPAFSRQALGVDLVSGEEDIRQSLFILFSTSMGERIMVPTYGAELTDFVFEALTTTLLTELEGVVTKAILNWEPRIAVERVKARPREGSPGLVHIEVDYVIRATNTRSNYVYPFYTTEATIPLRGP
jgi:uncharacterized protein